MKENRRNIAMLLILVALVFDVIGGTLAYWTWYSTENKSVVFNTVGNVSDYIIYDEGSSYFIGDFKPTDSYCESVNTTVSFYKTEDAEDIELRATINMDVNAIGTNIANSSDVYWVVTKGDNSIACSEGLSSSIVLGSGTFYGKMADETIKLVTDIEVTTTLEKYTVWIWINSNGTDLSKLSGETVDTNVWTQIDMVDPDYDNNVENNDNTYTITYNVNGGVNGPVNQDKETGESVTISSTVPTRTGYTFSGWNTIADGSGTSYSAGTSYSTDADLILYAVWTPNTYTIGYNANGGSGTTNATTCSYGKSCTLTSNTFTKTGYTFIGWTDSETGTEVVYEDGYTILLYNQTSNMTLYALWKINTYTVSYNANYGTGEPSDQVKTYGETLTLSETVPTREKHRFVEWNTKADGSGTSYQPGDSYSSESNITLFAIWSLKTDAVCPMITGYSGAYDGDAHSITVTGGSGGTIKYSTDNTNWSTTKPTLTDAGTLTTYVMVEADGSHNSVTCSSETITINKSPTATTGSCASLTYNGSAQTLASGGSYVSYSNNSGTNATSYMVDVTSDSNHTFSDGAESKTLSCSIAQKSATMTVSPTSLSITMTSSGSGSFTYTYDGDGSVTCSSSNTNVATCSVNTSTKTVTVTAKAAGSATITVSAAAGTNYKATSKTVSVTVSMQTYTVSYNACSGTGIPNNQTKTYGETLQLSSTIPTRTGYTFLGWATEDAGGCNATSAIYDAGANYTTNAAETLYAVWKESYPTLVSYITNLYFADSTVVNNSITYYRDTTDLIINDGFGAGGASAATSGNLRYYGADPNNYVTFNNETWRIVGVFTVDGVRCVKLVKGSSTGTNKKWDDNTSVIAWGSNTLYTYLKDDYYENSISTTAKSMIAQTSFNVSPWSNSSTYSVYADDYYNEEKNTTMSDYIGLLNASDYGYMYNFSNCTVALRNTNNSSCYDNNWFVQRMNVTNSEIGYVWLLNQFPSGYGALTIVTGSSANGYSHVNYAESQAVTAFIYPVVFLEASVKKTGGEGTSSSPYTLSL